jgi:preprotein translocase subunit YajC
MEQLLPLVLLLGVMYFLLIRPQQRRVKAQRALVQSLQVGDEVATIGGVLGRILTIDAETATVETTPGTILRLRRAAIAGKVGPEPAVAIDDADADADAIDEA